MCLRGIPKPKIQRNLSHRCSNHFARLGDVPGHLFWSSGTHTQRSMGQLTHRAGLRPEALQSGGPVTGPLARTGRAVTCKSLRPPEEGWVNLCSNDCSPVLSFGPGYPEKTGARGGSVD